MKKEEPLFSGLYAKNGKHFNLAFFLGMDNSDQMPHRTVKVIIKDSYLDLDIGSFNGDYEKAQEVLQSFANKNNISCQSLGFGCASLLVNGEQHLINPNELDISMMLQFCGINMSSLQP